MSDKNVHSKAGTAKERDLLSLVHSVVDACMSKGVEEQRKFAECLNRAWTPNVDTKATFTYFVPKKQSSDGTHLRTLLRAVEMCNDSLCLILLCKLIQDLISSGSDRTRQKRHHRLIKADATSALIRTLRYRLKEVLTRAKSDRKEHRDELNCLAEHADDTVAELILAVGVKDCRLSLKLRVGGVLQLLCSILASDCDSALSQTMTKLLCRCLRSPRNAQLAGRQRGFASRLLVRITSLEGRDPVQSQLLARHLEVLYFVTKNRKTRILLVGEGVTSCVLSLLDHHFLWRNSSNLPEDANDVHVEICLISVAVLRLLCNNKRAKEQLVACNVLLLCEQIMNGIEKDGQQRSNAMAHLQDSLCALCLRCLPTLPFPIIGSPFPLRLCFQKASSPTRRFFLFLIIIC